MALTERASEIYTVLEDGQIQVLAITDILRDGVVISSLHHRDVLEPGVTVSSRAPRLRDIAAVVWTKEVIEARNDVRNAASADVAPVIDPVVPGA